MRQLVDPDYLVEFDCVSGSQPDQVSEIAGVDLARKLFDTTVDSPRRETVSRPYGDLDRGRAYKYFPKPTFRERPATD